MVRFGCMQIEKIVAIRRILSHHPVKMAFLFGSHARGKAGPLSDIDIAVIPKQPKRFAKQEGKLFHDLAIELGTDAIDLVDLTNASPLLQHRAVLRGQALLEHSPHEEAVLKTHILHRFEDHRHFYAIKERAFLS